MKRFVTLLTVFVLIFTLAATSFVSADGETQQRQTGPGGVDFYSITIHYESPILMDYYQKNSSSVKLFTNPTVAEGSDAYVDKSGNSLKADKQVIGSSKDCDFYVLQSRNTDYPDLNLVADITAVKRPSKYLFYNHIQKGNVLMQVASTNFYGLTEPYDEGDPYKNQNPNVVYNSDGYALAVETDENGTPYRIDINGFLVTADNLWLSVDGKRCELFLNAPVVHKTGEKTSLGKAKTEWVPSGTYEALPFNDRFDSNGMFVNTKTLKYTYYVSNADYNAFISDDSQSTLVPKLYEYTAKREDYDSQESYEKALKTEITLLKKTNKVYETFPILYQVKYAEGTTDINKDGVVNYLDDATYYTREVTGNDIFYTEVDGKKVPVNGAVRLGTPQINVKIKDITIEIDALGTQLYQDLSADPQQQNTIYVTMNDCLINIEHFEKCIAENRMTQEEYDITGKGRLGSIKCVTTKTEMQSPTVASGTVKSVSLNLSQEVLANLSRQATTLYLNFDINTHQPEAAYAQYAANTKDFLMAATEFSPVTIQIKTDADLPPVIKAAENEGCCAGSEASAIAQIMFILGAALIIKSKKK